jgi:hypothetical protein
MHKYVVKAVGPERDGIIWVSFTNGVDKKYDVRNMIKYIPAFETLLQDEAPFFQVEPEVQGVSVKWNKDLDIPSDELYEHGTTVFDGSLVAHDKMFEAISR